MTNRIFDLRTARRETVSVHGAGLALGFLLGGTHLLWALLVASGFAQGIIDLLFWLHFIRPAWQIDSFELGRAAGLVALTGAIGYVLGAALSILWKQFQAAAR